MKAEMYLIQIAAFLFAAFLSFSVILVIDYFLKRKVKKRNEKRIKEHQQRVIRELGAKQVLILKMFQEHFEEIEDYEQALITQRMIDEIQNKDQG